MEEVRVMYLGINQRTLVDVILLTPEELAEFQSLNKHRDIERFDDLFDIGQRRMTLSKSIVLFK